MEAWIAVVGVIAIATITPGPNNFLMLDAGVRGGLSSAAPLIGAVIAGGVALLALVWAGAGPAFEAEPRLRVALMFAGAAWLFWLGVKMISSSWRIGAKAASLPSTSGGLPQSLAGVFAFQLVNPKAWVLMLTATAAIADAGSNDWWSFAVLAAIFTGLSGLCLALWTVAGTVLGSYLGKTPWFDRSMGAVLIASAAALIRA